MIARKWRPALALLLMAALALALLPAPRSAAQEETAGISASMNSYYYQPGESAYLDVEMRLPAEAMDEPLALDMLFYPSALTRSYLSSFREGSRYYPIFRRTLDKLDAASEWTDKEYEIDLKNLGLPAGVYPFEVRALQDGEVVVTDSNFLVIKSPELGHPLHLSLLWTMDFLPLTDARGNELDSGLAAACSSSSSETGYFFALCDILKRTPDVRSSMVLPYFTYRDLRDLAQDSEDEVEGEEDIAGGAEKTLSNLDDLLSEGRLDILTTAYAFADLDLLDSQGWEEDADDQLELGLDGNEEIGAGSRGYAAPLFHLSDGLLQRLVDADLEFTVVDEETVSSSTAGQRLLEGTTLSQPVNFINKNGLLLKAFMRDETMHDYLENTTQRDASHMVQSIFAELAVLQREKPYSERACVLAFPASLAPSEEFLEELYSSLKDCPWLQTRRLGELHEEQLPLEGVALQAPVYPPAASQYIQKLQVVRDDAVALSEAIPEDDPLREELRRFILTAETHRFLEEKSIAAAQSYLDSIDASIQAETSKVRIERKTSVTLSSTKGNLTVDVTSGLDYPLEATLRLENHSVTFPDGNSMEVNLVPQENRFVFSIDTRRKGSFSVDIVLESGGMIWDRTSTTVNTSIINSLAIILLAGLAFLVAAILVFRRLLARFRGGKHAKGRKNP